jgi:hypothetical protein
MKVQVPKVRADRGVTGELVPEGVAVGVLGPFLGPR